MLRITLFSSGPNIPDFHAQDVEASTFVAQGLIAERGTPFTDATVELVIEPKAVVAIAAADG
jgi:hypothetical protein